MNNTFDFNRFGKVLRNDGGIYFRNFGLTLAILCGIPIVGWVLTLVFGFTMPSLVRWISIYFTMFIAVILVPAKAFGYMNHPREGVRFAMLPASNWEKYLSYVLFCLLTPVCVIFCSWGIDSLLTLLPLGGFEHYIKSFSVQGIIQDFGVEMDADMDTESYTMFKEIMNDFQPHYVLSIIIGILLNIGIFMLGNMLFKTHKTAKTLVVMIGVSYAISMIMQSFLLARGIFPWQNGNAFGVSMDIETVKNLGTTSMTLSNILHCLLTIGVYIGLFFKIKTQKY